MHAQLDYEERKIQVESSEVTNLIQDRQDTLNSVEHLMSDISEITKQINTKVYDHRDMIIEIDTNTTSALTNTILAEEQIVQAAAKQKTTSKCMIWLIAIITITVLIIVLSVIINLSN